MATDPLHQTPTPFARRRKEHNPVSDTNSQQELQEAAELLLSAIRTAVLRAQMDAAEIETIGIALKSGTISPEYAVQWLADIGLVDQVLADEVRS
jgi:hypothetical protein